MPSADLARAEFYQCLSRAFLPPTEEALWIGMRDYLADDLAELGLALGLEIVPHLADYGAAVGSMPDRQAVLQRYSALFLAPMIRLGINTAIYLDGTLGGPTTQAMGAAYRRAGFAPNATLRDLPDHVAIQLEFVARCFRLCHDGNIAAGRRAQEFLATFVSRWLPPFIADLQQPAAPPNPWLFLARALKCAVDRDAGIVAADRTQQRHAMAVAGAREKRAQAGLSEKEMAFIAKRLRKNGLATDHLAIPPEQRDAERGWERKLPPAPR